MLAAAVSLQPPLEPSVCSSACAAARLGWGLLQGTPLASPFSASAQQAARALQLPDEELAVARRAQRSPTLDRRASRLQSMDLVCPPLPPLLPSHTTNTPQMPRGSYGLTRRTFAADAPLLPTVHCLCPRRDARRLTGSWSGLHCMLTRSAVLTQHAHRQRSPEGQGMSSRGSNAARLNKAAPAPTQPAPCTHQAPVPRRQPGTAWTQSATALPGRWRSCSWRGATASSRAWRPQRAGRAGRGPWI